MPEGTDRYLVDPGDPGKRWEERFRALEQKVAELDRRAPLNSAVFRGILRNVDENGDTLGTWGPTGMALEEGAFSVGGGPVRALDMAFDKDQAVNASLTTTPANIVTATLTVPTWANEAVVLGWIVFQMGNSTGAVVGQQYRVDIETWPGTGLWQSDVQPGGTQNVLDMQYHTLTRGVDLGDTIDVHAVCRVSSGTNSTNIIHIRAAGFFFR